MADRLPGRKPGPAWPCVLLEVLRGGGHAPTHRGFGGAAVLNGCGAGGGEVAWWSVRGVSGGGAAVERVAWLWSGRWGKIVQRWACLGMGSRVGRTTSAGGGLGGRLRAGGGCGNGGQALIGKGLGSSRFGGEDDSPRASEPEPESGPLAVWTGDFADLWSGTGEVLAGHKALDWWVSPCPWGSMTWFSRRVRWCRGGLGCGCLIWEGAGG